VAVCPLSIMKGRMFTIIMALVLGLALGAGLTVAASLIFPYERRFVRRGDRAAFLVSTVTTAVLGVIIFVASGVLLLVQLL
jgi:hypothetical protein